MELKSLKGVSTLKFANIIKLQSILNKNSNFDWFWVSISDILDMYDRTQNLSQISYNYLKERYAGV